MDFEAHLQAGPPALGMGHPRTQEYTILLLKKTIPRVCTSYTHTQQGLHGCPVHKNREEQPLCHQEGVEGFQGRVGEAGAEADPEGQA